MFLRSSKNSAALLLIWILWLAASSVCLALDSHACCPTEKADWHMDTVQVNPKIEIEKDVQQTEVVSCEVDDLDCEEAPDCFKLEVEQHLPPPLSLQISSTSQIHAPPIV